MARIIKSIFNSNAILGDTSAKRQQSMMAAARGAQQQPYNQIGGAAAGLIGSRIRQQFFPTKAEEANEVAKQIMREVATVIDPSDPVNFKREVVARLGMAAQQDPQNTSLVRLAAQEASKFGELEKKTNADRISAVREQVGLARERLDLRTAQDDAKFAAFERLMQSRGRLIDPNEINQAENILSERFDKRYEDYENRRSAVSAMMTLAQQDTGVADLSIITNYYKAQDPNSAVLRDETDIAKAATSLGGLFEQAWKEYKTGSKLSNTMRQELIEAAASRYNENHKDIVAYHDFIYNTAVRRGLNPKNVISNAIAPVYNFDTGSFDEVEIVPKVDPETNQVVAIPENPYLNGENSNNITAEQLVEQQKQEAQRIAMEEARRAEERRKVDAAQQQIFNEKKEEEEN